MKILLISQYFYPEHGATTNRILSFARGLAAKGHDVSVLCEFPNYPSGKLAPKDRFRFARKEKLENFTVFRAMVIPTGRSSTAMRLINYWSFMLSAFVVGLFIKRPDVVLVSSPPLFAGPAAVMISILKRVPLVADIRDLWPEDAIAMGFLNNPLARWGGRLTARQLYRRASLITTISEGLKGHLKRLAQGKEAHVVYNGSEVPDLYPEPCLHPSMASAREITVCYAGMLGLGHPIEDLVLAAEATRDDPTIRYLIVGDGVRRTHLMDQCTAKGLTNITFTGGVNYEKSLEYLRGSQIAVVALTDNPIFKSAIPSKFFDCMALGLPVILGVDGEARKVLEGNETGVYYRSGDWEDLKAKILFLKGNPVLADKFGANGQKLVYDRFRRSYIAAELERLLKTRFSKPVKK